jgi:AcrR family transcriptional regulator
MGTKERRSREKLETRDKILGAARDMFAEEGYDAVTMRGIADRVEYTPTALYHHFKNKQALLTEICQCDFGALARHFTGKAAAADPVERILAVGRAYLKFAVENPSQYRFMFMTFLPRVDDIHGEFSEIAQHFISTRGNPEQDAYAFLRAACQQAIEQGRMRPEVKDPDQLAQILWGAVHGLISIRMVKQREGDGFPWGDLHETVEAAMQALLRGILRDPSEQRAAS